MDALECAPHPEQYSHRFQRIAAGAGPRPIRLHSIRHSIAHWLHSLGVPPADGASLLGHRVDTYLSSYLVEGRATGASNAAAVLGRAVAAAG